MSLVSRAELLVYLKRTTTITEAEDALLAMLHPMGERAVQAWLQTELKYEPHVEFLPSPPLTSNFDDTDVSRYDVQGNYAVPVDVRAANSILQLRNTPVWLAGLEVREDISAYAGQGNNAFADATILTAGVDYWLDCDGRETDSTGTKSISRSGRLHRIGVWPNSPRSVKVTYYGGNSVTRLREIAPDIKYAVILTVAKAFWQAIQNQNSDGSGPLVSEKIGKWEGRYAGDSVATGAMVGLNTGMALAVPIEAQKILQPYRNYGRYR